MFERLRDAFRAALDAATPPGDLRDLARQMREAVTRTETALAGERQLLADAERRGRLAAEIQDQETVAVASRFAAKHAERVAVLERKLGAQRDELAIAEREVVEMQGQLTAADRGRPRMEGERSAERAWQDITAAGGARPGTDLKDELLKAEMDRSSREAAADRQLDALKKKHRKD